MVAVMIFLLQGAELLQIMVLGLFQRDAHHIEMTTLPVVLVTLIFLELHHVQQQGELMWMRAIAKGLKDLLLLRVTVREGLVIMTPFRGQNDHMLLWLVLLSIFFFAKTYCFNIIFCFPTSFIFEFLKHM
jgi:hypothetical protein